MFTPQIMHADFNDASCENPMQIDGFEFIEYASAHPEDLHDLFVRFGFLPMARHRSKDVTLYQQGDINFILNCTTNTPAANHAKIHGPGICAMAFRVKDAKKAYERAMRMGAESVNVPRQPDELYIPAIRGIGDSLIYFVDCYGSQSIYQNDFVPLPDSILNHHHENSISVGFTILDHLTHNVYEGRMDLWCDFYRNLFHFQEQRLFTVRGQKTGLRSRVMVSPCRKIYIPITESGEEHSQINEFLSLYRGEGIQHIALGTDDICRSVEILRERNIHFMPIPSAYYEQIEGRLQGHGQDLVRLAKNHILMDGEKSTGMTNPQKINILLQIFTTPLIGPIFFEIIQRKGHDGFGEGNFAALFEAIEQDQITRGVFLQSICDSEWNNMEPIRTHEAPY